MKFFRKWQISKVNQECLELISCITSCAWKLICENKSAVCLLIRKKENHHRRDFLFLQEVESIKELIARGFGVPLSEIRDTLNEKYGDSFISNKEVKLFVIEHFGDEIQFICSKRKN